MKGHGHPHESPHHPHWPLGGLLFLFVFLLGLFSVHESSTWRHVRTGGAILQHRALPASEPFSYTATEKPWTTDSWAGDVLFYEIHDSFGPRGLRVFKAAILAAAFALLLPLNYVNPIVAAGVLAAAAAAAWAAAGG
jgi:hypothetical protein